MCLVASYTSIDAALEPVKLFEARISYSSLASLLATRPGSGSISARSWQPDGDTVSGLPVLGLIAS